MAEAEQDLDALDAFLRGGAAHPRIRAIGSTAWLTGDLAREGGSEP